MNIKLNERQYWLPGRFLTENEKRFIVMTLAYWDLIGDPGVSIEYDNRYAGFFDENKKRWFYRINIVKDDRLLGTYWEDDVEELVW